MASGFTSVLTLPDYADEILGWVCFDADDMSPPVVHWIYTKAIFRQHGVARALMNSAVGASGYTTVIATQLSKSCSWLKDKVGIVFDPWVAG